VMIRCITFIIHARTCYIIIHLTVKERIPIIKSTCVYIYYEKLYPAFYFFPFTFHQTSMSSPRPNCYPRHRMAYFVAQKCGLIGSISRSSFFSLPFACDSNITPHCADRSSLSCFPLYYLLTFFLKKIYIY
jgi:hypothetical protein